MPASQFKEVADSISDKTLQRMRANPSFKNVREQSRAIGKFGGIPVMEQVVGAHMRWPDGQSGDMVLNSRIYAAKEAVYNFSLRESQESHRKDPGYFTRLVDTVRIE